MKTFDEKLAKVLHIYQYDSLTDKKAQDQAISQIKQLILQEVIGEDEVIKRPEIDNTKMGKYELNEINFNYGKAKKEAMLRNQHRQQQREVVK